MMKEVGRRLHHRGVIDAAGEIRFLEALEAFSLLADNPSLERMSRIRDLILSRKMARPVTLANWENRKPPVARSTKGSTRAILSGLAASSGCYTGRAVILRSEREFSRLQPGDVLVCVSTNPSWTPLFNLAGAVVSDLGSSLSHAAIVAREFGIPAVLNTQKATGVMEEGRIYTVDGTQGVVLTAKLPGDPAP
jgi:pyruvate,water dikinase